MNNNMILSRLNMLPEEFKREALDFIEYLADKYEKKSPNQSPKSRVFGSCKGLFIIPDDFDDPLEDFKDYM